MVQHGLKIYGVEIGFPVVEIFGEDLFIIFCRLAGVVFVFCPSGKFIEVFKLIRGVYFYCTAGDIDFAFNHHSFCVFDRVFGSAGLADKYAVLSYDIRAAAHFTGELFHFDSSLQ